MNEMFGRSVVDAINHRPSEREKSDNNFIVHNTLMSISTYVLLLHLCRINYVSIGPELCRIIYNFTNVEGNCNYALPHDNCKLSKVKFMTQKFVSLE